jgi:ribonuclease III
MGLRRWWRRLANSVSGRGLPEPEIEASQADLSAFEMKLTHRFSHPGLLQQSLLHRSHSLVSRHHRQDSNERLEFLGDAVLGLVVNDYLYKTYPTTSEGDLTKMKSLLVCRERLAEVASRLDLGSHIRMSPSEAATGGRSRASILADATEAVIGAVYLDGGLACARQVIHTCLLADCEEILLSRGLENFKSRLQEFIQARYKSPPRYRVISSEGPDHARIFKVSVIFNGRLLGQGSGPSKKIAEQAAAREALAGLSTCGDLLDGTATPGDD